MGNFYGYIYLTRNEINGKIYIGQHKSQCYDEKYYGSGKVLISAINKYGKENFSNKIIQIANSKFELDILEKAYIKIYNSGNRDIGYNIAIGGEGGNLIEYKTEEEKINIYEKMIETRKRLGIGVGENNPMYHSGIEGRHPRTGVKLTQETKDKISKSLMGHIPWNKGLHQQKSERDLVFDKVSHYLSISYPAIRATHNNGEVYYFKNKKDAEEYYKCSIKYSIKHNTPNKLGILFEKIDKELYLKMNGKL